MKSGQVRLNNAKPARDQNPLDVGGDGATYVKGGTRLQKVLAQSGVASRRGAEELIAAGRVEVDGEVVTEQGLRIIPRPRWCASMARGSSSTRNISTWR